MSDPWRPGDDPVPDDLRALLRAEADRHVPDREYILARLAEGRAGARVPDPLPVRAVPVRRRPVWLAAAAAVVAAAGTASWGLAAAGRPTPAAPMSSAAGMSSSTVPAAGTSPTPATTSGASAPHSTPTPAPSGHRTDPASPTAGTLGPPAATDAASSTGPILFDAPEVAAGSRFVLPGDGTVDWVAVGARRDGRSERAAHGTGALSVPRSTGTAPVVETSPVLLSWNDGIPEQSHVDATTWWAVPTGTGFEVSARAGNSLALLTGPSGGGSLELTVVVEVPGRSPITSVLPASTQTRIVAVGLDGVDPGTTVWVTVTGAGTAPRLGFGAVTLR